MNGQVDAECADLAIACKAWKWIFLPEYIYT